MPILREETRADPAAIREVNRLAFGRDDEADLVDRLREAGLVVCSLVAIEDAHIVGHILFTDLRVEPTGQAIPAAALAPVAVRPEYQHHGVGAALIRRGIDLCRERGKIAVIVLGHPRYYPRFGFSAELARNLQSPFSGDAWMALELTPGALEGVTARVTYPDAFGIESD